MHWRLRGAGMPLWLTPVTRRSASFRLRFRFVRACERARRSCAWAWERWCFSRWPFRVGVSCRSRRFCSFFCAQARGFSAFLPEKWGHSASILCAGAWVLGVPSVFHTNSACIRVGFKCFLSVFLASELGKDVFSMLFVSFDTFF